jgi:hypothetical protein
MSRARSRLTTSTWVAGSLLSLALAGCGESRLAHELREQTAAGELAKARSTAAELDSGSKNVLLAGMEQGLLAHLQGDPGDSNKQLDAIAPIVDDLRSAQVVDAVVTSIYNDTASTYVGKPFEHTQIDYYRTLNYLMIGERAENRWQPTGMVMPPKQPMAPVVSGPDVAFYAYQNALIMARRMTINQLKETADAADGKRYDDDPFARMLTAMAVFCLDAQQQTDSDRQLAAAMLKRALVAYQSQHDALSTSASTLRYEVAAQPSLATTLYLRHLRAYDPDLFADEVAKRGLPATDPRFVPPAGSGSVLILNHVGLIAQPRPLQIGIAAIGFSEKDATNFFWGGISFYAKGPGNEVAHSWPLLPIPGHVVQQCLAPGGAAVIGFEIPVHAPDQTITPPASVTVGGITGGGEVLCDLDAYARSTLKDAQPQVLLKTLLRVAVKQGTVAAAAYAARQQRKDSSELLAFGINLIGSALATATESADLRGWLTLPDHIEGTLIDLPAGTYPVSISAPGGSHQLGTVQVTPGRVTLVPVRTFPTPYPIP